MKKPWETYVNMLESIAMWTFGHFENWFRSSSKWFNIIQQYIYLSCIHIQHRTYITFVGKIVGTAPLINSAVFAFFLKWSGWKCSWHIAYRKAVWSYGWWLSMALIHFCRISPDCGTLPSQFIIVYYFNRFWPIYIGSDRQWSKFMHLQKGFRLYSHAILIQTAFNFTVAFLRH